MRTFRYLVGLALVASLGVVASPAQAVTTVDVQATRVRVIGDECGTTTVTYSGDWQDATAVITVYDPDGNGVFSKERVPGSEVTDQVKFRLCGNDDKAGTYDVEVYVRDYADDTEVTSHGYFTFVTLPKLKASISIEKRHHARPYTIKVIGTLRIDGKTAGTRGRPVVLQVWDGRWKSLDTIRVGSHGKFWVFFMPNAARWRYHFAETKTITQANAAFRVRHEVRATTGTRLHPGMYVL